MIVIKIKKVYFKLNVNMVLFFLGVVLGTVIINLLCLKYNFNESETLNGYFGSLDNMASFNTVLSGIFARRIILAVLLFAVLLFVNNIWIVYLSLLGAGELTGIVLTVLSMNMGIRGVPLFILMCFPHVFLYAASIYIVIKLKLGSTYISRINQPYKEPLFVSETNRRKSYILAILIFLIGVVMETVNAVYILPIATALLKM